MPTSTSTRRCVNCREVCRKDFQGFCNSKSRLSSRISRQKTETLDKQIQAALCPYPNYNGYIYNLKLNFAITSNESFANRGRILKALAALIAARIVHRYPMWKIISHTLFTMLLDELTLQLPAFISELFWKTNINIRAYNLDMPLDLGMPIIFDTFMYTGILAPISKGVQESAAYYAKPIDLTYSLTFYISPAIKSALPFYKTEGYKTTSDRTGITASTLIYYFNFLNRVKYDSEYDHDREWQNIIELTDYQNELTDKVSVIERLKELKRQYESLVDQMDKLKK